MLVVSTDDDWKSRAANGELFDRAAFGKPGLWRHRLPQELGPRRGWVSDTGAVLLVDDWINGPSPHALMLIGPDGSTLAQSSIDQLIALLGVSRRTVAEHAKLGAWLSSEPQFMSDGASMLLQAGGRELVLNLSGGSLSVR